MKRALHVASAVSAAVVLTVGHAGLRAESTPTLELEVRPHEARVGDPIEVTLTLELPPDVRLAAPEFGNEIGSFSVLSGRWNGPETIDGGNRWTWNGVVSAYELGELSIPALRVTVEGPAGTRELTTEPRTVTIISVLPEDPDAAAAVELADLKPPASLKPDLVPLWTALGILVVLMAGAAVVWWLQRRYGDRLAAVKRVDDPFARVPPHVWVYGELQKLLERRLPENGQVDLFYSELSRIFKLYLGGRYRLRLMEVTTAEARPILEQGGTPARAIAASHALLTDCDRVKFARETPGPDAWKAAVEEIYRIVDATKPVDTRESAAGRGVA